MINSIKLGTRHTGDDKRGLLFQFMMGIFLDVTRMNHGRDKTPDPHDLLLPHLAFDRPAWPRVAVEVYFLL